MESGQSSQTKEVDKYMREVRLLNGELKLVTRVTLPKFEPPPQVIVWGVRTFIPHGNIPDTYKEAFHYVIPEEQK